MDAAVRTRGVVKQYPGQAVPALAGLDLDIAPGESVGLLGPNGAGKTTLVKLLCGVSAPTAGAVEVLGGDPVADAARVKSRLGAVHQDIPVDNMLSALDNIRIAAAFRGLSWRAARPRAEQLMEEFGLTGVARQLAFTLSGGQARRLQLVRVLLVVPELLILDEPSAGLDVSGRRQLWDALARLTAQHGTTVIWTSHYLEEIERNCSRVLVVDSGRLIGDETPRALAARFGSPALVVRCPDPGDRAALRALVPAACLDDGDDPEEVVLSGPGSDAALPDVVRLVTSAAVRGATLAVRAPSLEDAYVALLDGAREAAAGERTTSVAQELPEPAVLAERQEVA